MKFVEMYSPDILNVNFRVDEQNRVWRRSKDIDCQECEGVGYPGWILHIAEPLPKDSIAHMDGLRGMTIRVETVCENCVVLEK